MALYGKTTLRTIQHGIDHKQSFHVGNVSAKWTDSAYGGRLPMLEQILLKADIAEQIEVFVVYSYQTPIAWWNRTEWFIPDIRYSSSTSGHQGKIRVMVHNPGFYLR